MPRRAIRQPPKIVGRDVEQVQSELQVFLHEVYDALAEVAANVTSSGLVTAQQAGVTVGSPVAKLNFASGATLAYDSTNARVNITVSGGTDAWADILMMMGA